MPLSASRINKFKSTNKEQWIPMGSGCYLVVPKSATAKKRFVGKTRIGSPTNKIYSVTLGFWEKDFTKPSEVLMKWDELKCWGKENSRDVRTYGERLILDKKDMSLKEVVELFLQWKSEHVKTSDSTIRNRLYQILRYLPDEILIDDFGGQDGRRFILERVCAPSIAKGHPYTAHRHRRLLNQLFNYALDSGFLDEEMMPSRLNNPFPFEANLKNKKKPHPHLEWSEFCKFVQDLNLNSCNASRLTDLSTKALLMMMCRVSAVVSMQWNWYDDKTNCWVIPSETTGAKRSFGDTTNDHYIPNTPQLETLMNNLSAINGEQKYVFFSPHKGKHPYVSPQTPNDHLINLGYKGRQDAHGFRHVATNALVDIGGYEREMVSRCLGHLHNDGAIGHYDFAKRLDKRKEIHECWSSLLIQDAGLRI